MPVAVSVYAYGKDLVFVFVEELYDVLCRLKGNFVLGGLPAKACMQAEFVNDFCLFLYHVLFSQYAGR